MATTAHALTALKNANARIERDGIQVRGLIDNHVIEFHDQDGSAICMFVRRVTAQHDSHSDYFAGAWMKNIKQAIKWAKDTAANDRQRVAAGEIDPKRLGLA